ncbi:MAG: DUF6144 family protein [Bacteroidales bacterium]|jgi:predicted hydrocarbon binding protein|nr:DUF6144 family protein [Bacteroidales bacterium]
MFDIRKIQEQVIYQAIKAQSNDETARDIVGDGTEGNPTWVKNTMKRLAGRFDPATAKKIRMNCQCGYAMDEKLSLLKELMADATNMEEFANNDKARAAGLYCQDNQLYLQFPFCPCPMLAEVERLEDLTWCQCTAGYSKVLFEKAFGCQVDVELLKSVKMGDDRCLMRIVPSQPVRFR